MHDETTGRPRTAHDRLTMAIQDHVDREGTSFPHAAMYVMTISAMAWATDLPPSLRTALTTASVRWFAGVEGGTPLDDDRLAAWKFLDEKPGSSSVVVDLVDVAVRALICVLYDQPLDDSDLEDTLDFFAGLMDRYDALRAR